jgi:hypothetical protein
MIRAAENGTAPVPSPLVRPRLAQFLWERDISFREAGRALDRTGEWVRLICLPFDDPRRRIPDLQDIQRIYDWTGGEVTAGDFYPAAIRGGAEAGQ